MTASHRLLFVLLALAWPTTARPGPMDQALAVGADWTSSRHDSTNTASTRIVGAEQRLPQEWQFSAGAHVWGYEPQMSVWSSAAVGLVAGKPVVAVGNYDHNVYLLDAVNGEEQWHFTTGDGVYAAPLLWQDSGQWWLFAASADRAVYGLDAVTGERRWSQAVESYQPTQGGARLSSPCLGTVNDQPALFVGVWVYDKSLSNHLQRGGLVALQARSGNMLWQADFLDNRVSAPVFARIAGRGYVFAASEDGNLRALDADTGKVLWSHRETEPILGSPALVPSSQRMQVIIGSNFGKVRSLDAQTGSQVWEFKTGYWVTGAAAVYRENNRELVAFGAYDNKMYAIDARSGALVWSQSVAGAIYSSPAVAQDEGGAILVASAFDHQLHGFSGKNGNLLFSTYTGDPIWDAISLGESNWSSPVAASINGRWMIYFGSYNGTFYAIPLTQAGLGAAPLPWSNARFWVIMALTLAGTLTLALVLTRRGSSNPRIKG